MITPLSTLSISTKFLSLKSSILFLTNLVEILSLSAPGAAKLENPFALSKRLLSCLAFINSSLISRPIL